MKRTTTQHTMQDFVFGGIESDPSRLLETEQNRWRGIRHMHQTEPRDPQPGEPVTITVTVGQDVLVDRVTAYVTTDGSDPVGERGVAENGFAVDLRRVDVLWQPLIWDYVDVWQGTIPGQPEGTLVHYRIEGWQVAGGRWQVANGAARTDDGRTQGASTVDDSLLDSQFAIRHSQLSIWSSEMSLDRAPEQASLYGYHVDRYGTPAWAKEAVIYQIFVDRFARGADGRAVDEGWLEPAQMNEFRGGDLPGVRARLDHIAGLGVTAIWLTPVFTAHSYHGYDTIDYTEIDPRFGTKDDLRALVQAAHARGIRVILDFVANHTSSESPLFREAERDPHSPYRDWFTFDDAYKHGYRCFFDVASMPQFNVDNRAVRRYLCDAARYWLAEFDVDGYRLDYAAGPSHSFWSEFSAACKEAKSDCWLFGEVTRLGDLLRSYAGRLDGCLDFGFTRVVRQLCTGPRPTVPLSRFVTYVDRTRRFFPSGFTLPAFVDNHDMNRFLWLAQDDAQRLRLALGLLFTLGGPPVLYYGTEVGLSQPRGKGPHREEARHPMPWDDRQDRALLDYTKKLIALRRRHPALIDGSLVTHLLDEERAVWLGARRGGDDRVWLALNAGSDNQRLPRPQDSLVDAITEEPISNHVFLPARSLRILIEAEALQGR